MVLLIACAQAQYEDFDDIDPFMVSPTLAVLGEFPSAVFIRSPGTPLQPLCGGTIIDRNHVSFFLTFN